MKIIYKIVNDLLELNKTHQNKLNLDLSEKQKNIIIYNESWKPLKKYNANVNKKLFDELSNLIYLFKELSYLFIFYWSFI